MIYKIEKYIKDNYNPLIENPWEKYPNFKTFKNRENNKWLAIIMNVEYNKLNIQKDGSVYILNLKCIPDMIGSLRKKEGILKAYHMNKEHWITILLDGTINLQEITNLIDLSYKLTKN